MSDPNQLAPVKAQVQGLLGSRRRARFLATLGGGAFVAALVLAILAVTCALGGVAPATVAVASGVLAALTVAVAAIWALAAPVDEVAIAKRYDDAIRSQDLLSSALELDPTRTDERQRAFVTAVHEDASLAAGRDVRDLFPVQWPRFARFTWVPLLVAGLAMVFWAVQTIRSMPVPEPPLSQGALAAAASLEDLLKDTEHADVSNLTAQDIERLKNLADQLKREQVSRRDALAEVARLASQLDKEREELERKAMAVQKNAARLATGEDSKDAQDDMQAGRYREAAQKVKKKIGELEKKLQEAIEKKLDKMEIEKLRQRLEKMRQLLAELEQLDALGSQLGFSLEVLDVLDRIEGELGDLRDAQGMDFDDIEVGRAPQAPRQPQDGQQPDKLFASPSNDAGVGHGNKVLGPQRRSLSDGEEKEVRMREGAGKSSFGQVKTANDGSRSRTGYREAYLAAKRAADDAIYRQDVPPAYRRYIHDYFERMQPDTPPPSDAEEGK